jgi:hypothetical protein
MTFAFEVRHRVDGERPRRAAHGSFVTARVPRTGAHPGSGTATWPTDWPTDWLAALAATAG